MRIPWLTGGVAVGDEVVVNVEARDLGLGSGGFDVVHVNLSRLPSGERRDAHVMKLNYTSLQHAVRPVEEGLERLERPLGMPVGVLALHGQLACAAFAASFGRPALRCGYVQIAGGALPGPLSDTVAELLERGLLCDHVTVAPCFGGGHEAITVEGALHAAAGAWAGTARSWGRGRGSSVRPRRWATVAWPRWRARTRRCRSAAPWCSFPGCPRATRGSAIAA